MEFIRNYFEFWRDRYPSILEYAVQHLIMSALSLVIGILVTIPLAILLTRLKRNFLKSLVFNIANVFQTVPTIAMLALMIPILGIGMKPAVTAMFLYSLLPLLRNTYAGIQSIDSGIVDAAKGMGYNSFQSLIKVELPLAMPYIMSGIRVTSVYIISWVTMAAVIGAGGLGGLIISGIGFNDKNLIFTGTLLAIVLAVATDLLFARFEKSRNRTRRKTI
ncbi:ABC transporter permease [Mammaliicoccus sciuri]|uniref:ABC transporter permease n=1 Tax=Sporosarcina TaxID=1569 RepID=UPI001C8D0700|nr:ABC transporter permease [Sporosarcina aquimarina]MBY0223982.1 ABC transporter permease [Sporosarcina aquimarina]